MIIKLLDALFGRELIGNPNCPIMYRWYIRGKRGHKEDHALKRKWMIHYFLPDADDEDPHDHPRGFWTLVLRGMYQDIRYTYEDECRAGRRHLDHLATETMRPFMLRYRPARHLHRTRVGPKGCWTIVMMTKFERDWGFVREGRWWHWSRYLAEIGNAMLCPGSEEAYRREGIIPCDDPSHAGEFPLIPQQEGRRL